MREKRIGTVIDLFSPLIGFEVYLTRKREWEEKRIRDSKTVDHTTLTPTATAAIATPTPKNEMKRKKDPKIGLTVSLRPRFASIVWPMDPFFLCWNWGAQEHIHTHTSPFEQCSYLPWQERHHLQSVYIKKFFVVGILIPWDISHHRISHRKPI